MTRKPRLDGDDAVHHVMNRGVNHQRIFFGDADRVEFGERLADIHVRFGIETLAYALMTNHYHLLLRTPEGGLSDAMHRVGLVYVKRTNDRVGRDGPLFRSRFHSIRVTTDAYLAYAARYIHRNPLDLPAVDRADGYRWSSYRTYLRRRPAAPFVNTGPVLSLFGGDRRAVASFTETDESTLGGLGRVTVADVRQLIQLGVGVREMTTSPDERMPLWLESTVMLLVSDAVADTRLAADLVGHFDFPTPNAEYMARRRARERSEMPVVRELVAEVVGATGQRSRAA